ncbi:hypothetical protein [Winogradskyella tangerina]|uniref:hypothetical protein n=1 Tax=Winogradskyella tangerina TaxID=2023240 RepID=UPI000DBE3E5B|nr:hypothetical protein [Winogradskyella tangerina]
MANKRDLKKEINYVLGEIMGYVEDWEKSNSNESTKESNAILDDTYDTFLEFIGRVNDRSVEDKKAHFKAIRNDLEEKGRALIERINKL